MIFVFYKIYVGVLAIVIAARKPVPAESMARSAQLFAPTARVLPAPTL